MNSTTMKKFEEQLACFGRNNILWAAMDEGLDLDVMDGCAPQQLCAEHSNNDWGVYDRLPADKQQKWDRKTLARNQKSLAFWVNYFRPISMHLSKSADVLSTILHRPFPKEVVPGAGLRGPSIRKCISLVHSLQLDDNLIVFQALMSQMAQFPHYDASLSTSLLRIFLEPTWYDKGKKFRLDHCAERLFAHAAPSAAFMKIWTRILVGNPEVEAPWHAFECGTARMLRLCTRHSPEFCPMEIWDAYSVLLVSNSPIITPEIQGLIISQTRYNFVGFRIILHKLFPVAREVLPLRRSGPELGQNEFDAAMLFVTLAEERQMRWMDEEEAWLKQVLPSVEPVWKARLARIKSSVSSSKDVILSTDVFCAWCLKKSANPKSCSRHRCKGPSYCDTECQRSAWKAHHKHVCTDDVDRFRTADSAIMNVRT